jgi:hypothetical protein
MARRAFLPGFFDGQHEIPGVMQSALKGEPEVSFFRILDTPDRF